MIWRPRGLVWVEDSACAGQGEREIATRLLVDEATSDEIVEKVSDGSDIRIRRAGCSEGVDDPAAVAPSSHAR